MEITDLAGLSEPLKKLIEVCSSGIGKWYEPLHIKRLTNAKAYEIEVISKALSENNVKSIIYDQGNISIENTKEIALMQSNNNCDELAEQQILNRISFQEAKKQNNINKTLSFAYDELSHENSVSDDKVDEDWITRFFNTIEDISNEHMQLLWAKILAGEIKKPKTYSLRTLELLKNLSFSEAEIFSKIGKFAVSVNNNTFIIGNEKTLNDKFKITFQDILLLSDLGLLHLNPLAFEFDHAKNESYALLKLSKDAIVIKHFHSTPAIKINIYAYTNIGKELLNLLEPSPNESYITYITSELKKFSPIQIFRVSKFDEANHTVNLEDLKEI